MKAFGSRLVDRAIVIKGDCADEIVIQRRNQRPATALGQEGIGKKPIDDFLKRLVVPPRATPGECDKSLFKAKDDLGFYSEHFGEGKIFCVCHLGGVQAIQEVGNPSSSALVLLRGTVEDRSWYIHPNMSRLP